MSGGEDLVFEGVGFAFPGGEPILEGLSFRAPAGRVTALIGLSGCGKSTVLRLAAGLLEPTVGRIQRAQQRLAFVFQQPTLLPWRTARENVALPLELGEPLADGRQRVMDAMATCGLLDAADKLPRALSGGMAMRVSLARALVIQPQVLLLDEPFSAQDALTRRGLYTEVLDLQQDLGLTTLLVTHDVDEAALFADQVIVLKGRPARVGECISVALPRPRRRSMLREPALAAIAQRLEEAV